MTEDPSQAEKDAVEFAYRAVTFDQEGKTDAAIFYYKEAAQSLHTALLAGSQLAGLKEKAHEYLSRVEELLKQIAEKETSIFQHSKSEQQQQLERAQFLLYQGLDEDEAGNKEEAVDLYSEAVDLCLKARNSSDDVSLKEKLTKVASHALERAEALKGIHAPQKTLVTRPASPRLLKHPTTVVSSSITNHLDLPTLASPSVQRTSGPHVSGSDSYTREELEVLRKTSRINGREYVPFMAIDLRERFAYPMPFSDRDGYLALSHKQRANFKKWVRPEEVSREPKIIEVVDCFSIKQTIVTDCSFVASLAVSALYEKRFKKRIITRIIYPQNRQGEPVYNPCGKYMVKLNINGVLRKIVIDDFLPMGVTGELLCSYSSNRNEFWISILEKAYLKVMGGYDFPGSNSNIDLHALTGWIPERHAIHPGDHDFNKENIFSMLLNHHHKGNVLTSVATGDLGEAEADRAGLVPTHAYAVLDVREVLGKRLFLLKNPWSHLRWKGNFSERDTINWTPKMKEALKFEPRNAQMFDNGVFWIDYDSVCKFFDVLYLSWNPKLFQHTFCIHQTWTAAAGPVKDLYNIGDNPQYYLELKSSDSTVWILLTRHITDRDDFAHNKEYITVVVYKNDGRRVYLPYDPEPYIDGVRINSPHYLCKLVVPLGGTTRYTLVVSQYEKTNTINYTLRAYASCPLLLSKIPNTFTHKQEVKDGEWTANSAGGCANHMTTYQLNPVYQVVVTSSKDNNNLLIDLKGPRQYSVGFDVLTVTTNNPNAPGRFTKKSSGVYRSGFTILELQDVPAGTYNIIPTTFNPGQKGPFFLTVQASCPIKMSRLR